MASERRSIDVVVNPAAKDGRNESTLSEVTATLRETGIEPILHRASSRQGSVELLASLRDRETERVILVGGDGLVHLGVNAFAGTTTVLGLVGAGSGNDGVRSLGLPTAPRAAVLAALRPASAVDLIAANDSVALTVATGGFPGDVTERANSTRMPLMSLRYIGATLAEFPRMHPRALRLTLDGRRWEYEAAFLVIANTPYFGAGMKIAPGADPRDGALDVIVGLGSSRSRYLRLLPQVFSGNHVNDDFILRQTVREVTVEALDGAPLELWADGERWQQAPVTLRCRPADLMVAGISGS